MQQLQDVVVPIKYVGAKPEKHDTVNRTGTVWKKGQTLNYPAKYAKALLVHTDVWRIGRKEEVSDQSAEHGAVVAASAPEMPAGSSSGGPKAKEADDPGQTQSQMVHDRQGSTKQHRVSLE